MIQKITVKTSEQIEIEKGQIKAVLDSAFEKAKELGISVDVPRHGHMTLNPTDFCYYHKDEIWHLDYKVQL